MFGPVQVLEGQGAAARVGDVLVDQWNVELGPIFVLCDPELTNLVTRVRDSLERRGYRVDLFTAVAPEPDLAVAESVAAAVRRQPFVAVVGFGGGSTLDMAKVAAVAARNEGSVEAFIGDNRVSGPISTLALVPTTAGSGAEASRNAMVSVKGIKQRISSARIVPSIAVLDPALTTGLPPHVTAAGGMDALSHAVESYLSTSAMSLTDQVAVDAIRGIVANLPKVMKDPGDLLARREMLAAAYFGGLALNAGAVIGHSIAYTIAARTTLGHGATCALALPYALAYNLGAVRRQGRLKRLAEALTGDRDATPLALVEIVYELAATCNLPTSLQAVGIEHTKVPAMAQECLTRFPRPNNPEPLDIAGLTLLYEHMFDGDPLGMMRTPRFAA